MTSSPGSATIPFVPTAKPHVWNKARQSSSAVNIGRLNCYANLGADNGERKLVERRTDDRQGRVVETGDGILIAPSSTLSGIQEL